MNESADAERDDHEQCRNCNPKDRNITTVCEQCSKVVVWYFSPIEECAGRVTVDKDGIIRRYAMDGIDEAVKKMPLSTICPRPPLPMSL